MFYIFPGDPCTDNIDFLLLSVNSDQKSISKVCFAVTQEVFKQTSKREENNYDSLINFV